MKPTQGLGDMQDVFISNLSLENMHGVKSKVRRLIPTNYIASKIGKIFNLLKGPLKGHSHGILVHFKNKKCVLASMNARK